MLTDEYKCTLSKKLLYCIIFFGWREGSNKIFSEH